MTPRTNLTLFGRNQRMTPKLVLLVQLILLVGFVGFGFLWYGVLTHLEGWGLVLGIIALVERVFRLVKAHYKVNGRYWLDM